MYNSIKLLYRTQFIRSMITEAGKETCQGLSHWGNETRSAV